MSPCIIDCSRPENDRDKDSNSTGNFSFLWSMINIYGGQHAFSCLINYHNVGCVSKAEVSHRFVMGSLLHMMAVQVNPCEL